MSITTTQLKQLLSFSPLDKDNISHMKKEYMKLKIQEAKDKKCSGLSNLWDILPIEVEEKIIKIKYELEKDYIPQMITQHNLTMKSFEKYIFREYRNETGEGIERVLAINYSFPTFLNIMINKKSWEENYYPRRLGGKTYFKTIATYEKITKNKTPSLEDYIQYRNKLKEQEKEERKKKAVERQLNEDLKSRNNEPKFKIGDIIYTENKYYHDTKRIDGIQIYKNAYIITGETKTQWRVDRLIWSKVLNTEPIFSQDSHYWYGLTKDKSLWMKEKSKNIGKKSYIRMLTDNENVSECPYDCNNMLSCSERMYCR